MDCCRNGAFCIYCTHSIERINPDYESRPLNRQPPAFLLPASDSSHNTALHRHKHGKSSLAMSLWPPKIQGSAFRAVEGQNKSLAGGLHGGGRRFQLWVEMATIFENQTAQLCFFQLTCSERMEEKHRTQHMFFAIQSRYGPDSIDPNRVTSTSPRAAR